MKSSTMKFTKKLKSIKASEYLNQDRFHHMLTVTEGISDYLPKITAGSIWRSPQKLEDHQIEIEKEEEEAENIRPSVNQIPRVSSGTVTGIGRKSLGSGFRRPDLNSYTLFDPKLLEAFELAVKCYRKINDFCRESRIDEVDNIIVLPDIGNDDNTLPPVIEVEKDGGEEENVIHNNTLVNPLWEFEEMCPPGGEESVVFYTTSLRGIRKTFDDCNMIRFLLDSFKVKYYERDVSMHREYREELRLVSSTETDVLPPVLFVKGRCIGGAQRVLCLHEQGKFKVLFEGVPMVGEESCLKCDGFRFVMCDGCRGSRRIVSNDGSRVQCLLCNENGLIVCCDCS